MQDYKPSINIEVTAPEGDKYTIVSFNGELDKAGLASIKEKLNQVVETFSSKILVFDFTNLNFINSEGIGFLMTIHYRLTKKEKELVILSAPEHVFDVLDVIGLLSVIKYYKTMSDFKESLSQ